MTLELQPLPSEPTRTPLATAPESQSPKSRFAESRLPAVAVEALAADVRGTVLRPADPDFALAAGVWNVAAAASPALIVRVADAGDIAHAIAFAREHRLEIAIRGGGHSVAGHSSGEGVLVMDTRGLRSIDIDPAGRVARVGAGLTAGEVTAATAAYGLAAPFGDTASVGVAGITLGGGIGYLARKHGLTVDSLRSAELVSADGRVVTASPGQNPDLFWAIRGGGGNFGVVTSLEFDLHPVDRAYGGALLLPATWNVLRGLAPIAGAAPEALTLIANLMPAPPAPFVPAERVGTPVVAILGVFLGDEAAGAEAFAPLRALATPIADTVGVLPYAAIYDYTAAASIPHPSATRTIFLEGIDDDIIGILLSGFGRSTAAQTIVQLRVLGGAMGRVPAGATAFAHRQASVMVTVMGSTQAAEALPPTAAWASGLLDELRPYGIGAYANFLEDEGEARIREAYPARTYRRLAAVKAAWDPGNVFHRNQNIRPAPRA
ncbi:MAG TPA: FAD-binding oxidoreductase [Candidatus Limnocylindrales bacterium]